MKFGKGVIYRQHLKISSEDLNNSTNNRNSFISKLLNKSGNIKINTETIENENLGDFKSNMQNIFGNDDIKKKAIQYIIKKNREKSKSPVNKDFLTLMKNIHTKNNKSEITVNQKNNLNKKRNSNKFEINNENNGYKTFDNNYYSLCNLDTFIDTKDKNNNINIDISENRKNLEKIQNDKRRIKSNIFLDNKESQNYNNYNYQQSISNNILKNYQKYGLYNDKNYNMMKIKNKMLNIQNQNQNMKYPQVIQRNQNQDQTAYNTQINFNYNTNQKYYAQKNFVYSKVNYHTYKEKNNSNTKMLLNKNDLQPKISSININNTTRNNNIIVEKIFNPKKLSKIDSIHFMIKPKKNIKYIIKDKNQIKFSKDKLINCNHNDFEIINNKEEDEFNFKNEKEMINYIKNKYNDRKLKEILDLKQNIENEEEYIRLKEENNILKGEIDCLKDENELIKVELNDIRNQYNDINKELKITKEENEKLKDNFINNLIEDDNNSNFEDE